MADFDAAGLDDSIENLKEFLAKNNIDFSSSGGGNQTQTQTHLNYNLDDTTNSDFFSPSKIAPSHDADDSMYSLSSQLGKVTEARLKAENALGMHSDADYPGDVYGKEYIINEVSIVDVLLPNCMKLSRRLKQFGHTPLRFSPSDINADERHISVFVVDIWAESLLAGVAEMADRITESQGAALDSSLTARKGDASFAALQTRVSDLQTKLLQSERKEDNLTRRINELEDFKNSKSQKGKQDEGDLKKITRNLEYQIQESERRVRQRDAEIERLREKLRVFVHKDNDVQRRHREALQAYKQGLVSSPSKLSLDNSRLTNVSSPSARGGGSKVDASRVIEALESQRDSLLKRNKDLEQQLLEFNSGLKDNLNGSSLREQQMIKDDIDNLQHESNLTNSERSNYSLKIDEQRRRIEQLSHRCEIYKKQQLDNDVHINEIKGANQTLNEEVENLRIEIESRPTIRQMKVKQKELEDLESRVHDLVMKRGESAEISSWKKYLDTTERIKVDKRNHELGLWLLESLPKAVMKETLQGVCRELDLSDVADILPSLSRLKIAVQAIPRMEKFITTVCAFVSENDSSLVKDEYSTQTMRPVIDNIPLILRRWHQKIQLCDELIEFSNLVLGEIERRDNKVLLRPNDTADGEGGDGQDSNILQTIDGLRGKTHKAALLKIREICDLEIRFMKYNKSFGAAEDFLRDQPDVMVNRIVSHIQYLFQVRTLDGLLPKLNQVYIKYGEIQTFLKEMKESLGLADERMVLPELRRVTSRTREQAGRGV